MATKKITELPDTAGVVAGTLVEVVDNPGGSPVSAKATAAQIAALAPVTEVNGQTGTVVLDHDDVGADEAGAAAAAAAASVPRSMGIVVVDSDTPVTRPDAAIVLWLADDTNAVAGDWRPAVEE